MKAWDLVKFVGETIADEDLVHGEMYRYSHERIFEGVSYSWISNMNMPFYGSFVGWVRTETIVPVEGE